MDAIATGLATHAPKAAALFARAFANSGGWAQFLTIAWALKRFGFFKALGKQIAKIFVVPFMQQFGIMFAAELGGEAAAGGLIARMTASSSKAGGVVGKAFGKAFIVGAAIGLVALAPTIEDAVRNSSWYQKHIKKGSTADKILSASGIDAIKAFGGFLGNQFGKLGHPKQTGGIIPYGGISVVGESGPELASVTPRGTMIRPMGGSAMPSNGMPAIPNLEDKLHVTVYSTIMVEKRQIARAVSDSNNYDTARRGGRAPYGS